MREMILHHSIFRPAWQILNAAAFILLTAVLYVSSFVQYFHFKPVYLVMFRQWSNFFVRALGVNLKLHRHSRQPLPDHFIMIANHPSAFEDIGLPALFNVTSLAKAEVADWWILGRISTAAGTLYVKRESRKSRAQALSDIVRKVSQGENLALYPEGGCKDKLIAERFYFGAFEASLQTGVPIVPVFIHYEAQDDFFWRPNVPLVQKLWEIMTASNHTANFHVFDVFKPEDFADKQTYTTEVHKQYLKWQEIYLK